MEVAAVMTIASVRKDIQEHTVDSVSTFYLYRYFIQLNNLGMCELGTL